MYHFNQNAKKMGHRFFLSQRRKGAKKNRLCIPQGKRELTQAKKALKTFVSLLKMLLTADKRKWAQIVFGSEKAGLKP